MVELKGDKQDRKEPSPSMMNGHTQTKDGSPRTSKTSKDAAAPTPAALANKVLPESIVKDMQFRSHSLGGVDLLWLLLVRGTAFNPVCCSTYTFDRKLNVDELRETLERQCDIFPKYRQHLAIKDRLFHAPYYKDDPDFSVDRHFTIVELPGEAGPTELNRVVSDLASKPWDEKLPLWEMIYFPNYSDKHGAKSAMCSRGHHTQADGQGFILSALYMTSYGKEMQQMMDEGAAKLHDARTGQLRPSEMSPLLRSVDPLWQNPLLRPFVAMMLFTLYWTLAGFDAILRIGWSVVHLLYSAFFYISTIWRIDMVVPVVDGERRAVFSLSEPLKLSDVKTIQKAFSGNRPGKSQRGFLGHVTINDVLCSIMADVVSMAIARRQPVGWNDKLKRWYGRFNPMPIALFIPISVREPGQYDMRNLSTGALAYLGSLPQAEPTVKQIHKHIHKSKISLNVIKRSFLPSLAFHCFQLMGNLPILFWPIWGDGLPQQWPMKQCTDFILSKVISSMPAILTNIPGPSQAADLAGGKALRWTALPPQGGRGVLAIGVITYDGSVAVTAAVDRVPGYEDAADRICKDFEERFKLYLRRAEEVLKSAQ